MARQNPMQLLTPLLTVIQALISCSAATHNAAHSCDNAFRLSVSNAGVPGLGPTSIVRKAGYYNFNGTRDGYPVYFNGNDHSREYLCEDAVYRNSRGIPPPPL